VQIQPEGASYKRKTRDNVRKVQELFTPQGANHTNKVCPSSCLGPKINANIWFHSIKRRPTRDLRYANVVPFQLILTKDQSLTPQQQDLDRVTVRRGKPSRTGTPAHHAGTSASHLGTSGHAGTSASCAGTPGQFSGNRAREKEAEQAASQEHEVHQFNVYQLPHVDRIHRVLPYSNYRCKRQLIVTTTWVCGSNSNSGMRRELTRSVRQVIHARIKQRPMATK